MPAYWTKKDERQYKHILESCRARAKGTAKVKRCKEIAARTVQKQRVREGRAKTATCTCPRGTRVSAKNPNRCWRPGKKGTVAKTCHG